MRLGVDAALVEGVLVPGDVEVVDGTIAAVGLPPHGGGGVAAPGFVDLQVNGVAGVDFLAAEVDDYRRAGDALVATGVTSYQPTFVSSPETRVVAALRTMATAAGSESGPRILGAHLEGPFLSPRWIGAHDPDAVVAPDLDLLERLLDAGPVTTMTLAPERPGALDLIDRLRARGVVVWIGHTDADAETAHAAFDRGAQALTHAFNAHRRFAPRDPGPAGVALSRPDVTVGLIADLVHVAPDAVRLAVAAAPDRVALVTDATAAAAHPPGVVELGGRRVVSDGVAVRLDDAEATLAGSALTMDQAVRNLVTVGASLDAALRAATIVPARLAGRPELAALAPGSPADVVVLDDELRVTRVLVGGRVLLDRG